MKPSQATAARTDCWLTKLALLIRRFFEFSAHDLKWNLNFGKTAYADQIRRSIGGTLYCLLMMMAFHCQTALADTPYNVIAQFTDVSQTFGGGSNYGTMTIQGTFYINASSVVTSISGATIQYGSNPAVSLSLVSANSLGGNDNKFFPSVSPHVTGGGLVLNDGTRYLAWIVDAGYSSGSDPTNEWLENYGSSLPSDPFMVAQPVSLSALAIPSVTGLSPASGPSAGGTSVTITGSNLTGVSAVKFGASNATSFNFVNDTQVTAVAPAGSGQVDVTVTTSGGTSVTGAGDQFTYIPTPTVTSLSVSAGPTAGGTSVVVTGTNFTGATVVKFGASNASSFNVNSATQITATAPAGSTGAVDITVTTPGGTSSTSASDVYTYVAAPTVTSLSVTSGSTAGGTSVVITGTNFTGATAVKFGSTNATSYTVNSATQITATAPAGSAGTVDVTVVTAGGTSATSASDQYTYAPSPAVTSLSVASGPTAGGTSVIITGTNFTAATAVKFGATNATSFTVNSATQITATSPSGSPGTVDVTVTTVSGISSTAAADQFTYVAVPTVSNLGTSAGPTAGGNSVVITGTNFSGATAVKFGANNAASFNVNSATQITATAPAGSAGAVDITVTTPGGTSATSASDVYTYVAAPTVTSLSVTSGSAAGGTSVVITGTNFTGATAVKFGSTIATSYAVNSATQITATAPAGSAGTVDVTVVTAGGTSATSASDQYTYVPSPAVTSLSVASGPTAGGTSVIITGTNFTGATTVRFGANNVVGFTVNSATSITASSPAGSAGTVDITVVTAGGTSATNASDQFTYAAAPTVVGLSQTAGPTAGGTSVTITGTNLTGATTVKFGANNATGYTVNSATSITATSAAGAAGTVDITVVTPGGTSATGTSDQYTYVALPTVTGVSPPAGPTTGGTSVTITGTSLTGATAVKFGASNATSFTVNSATSITATSPAGSAGMVDITVVTAGGTSATSASDQFIYTVRQTAPVAPAAGGGTVSVQISGGSPTCSIDTVSTGAIPSPANYNGLTPPLGAMKVKIAGCNNGDTVTIAVTFSNLNGLTALKYGPTPTSGGASIWYIPNGLSINGNTITYTVTDGGLGDSDLTVNGIINDPIVPVPAPPSDLLGIPTLNNWGLLALSGLMAVCVAGTFRRRSVCDAVPAHPGGVRNIG